MKNLLTVTMIAGLVFGLGFVIVPEIMLDNLGITNNLAANAITRNMGTALLGFVVLLWFGRKSTNPEVHKIVLTTLFVYWVLSSVTMIIGQLSGVFSIMGWGTVALHLAFMIVFGIYLYKS